MAGVIENMTNQEIINRYCALAEAHVDRPDACFVCGIVRPVVNALVLGPSDKWITLDPRPMVIGRGHGVCRPCIRRGGAIAV